MYDECEFSVYLNSKILIYQRLLILTALLLNFVFIETTFVSLDFLNISSFVSLRTRCKVDFYEYMIKDHLVDEHPVSL